MNVEIAYMSGAGNTFVVLDNRHYRFSLEQGGALAKLLCTGIVEAQLPRTEGLMLLDATDTASGEHFAMNFFNPDGSHGAMCGNGGRCAVRFAERHGFFEPNDGENIYFSTLGTRYKASLHRERDTIRLFFPTPEEIDFPLLLTLDNGDKLTAGFVNVGSDHAVIWFPEANSMIRSLFSAFDIAAWGATIRHHPYFPRGANANFYTIVGKQTLNLRTFERGVEAETGACGTGALSTAIIAYLRHDIQPPVRILPPSGEELIVNFSLTNGDFTELSLEGNARIRATMRVEV
ncbi:MAG: diaminopimelate epimerase [Candidatus Kapaibacterium sp.]|nr:MAG: diaminopimelate epimerase [Candidatus Kapabacteria bacterium]